MDSQQIMGYQWGKMLSTVVVSARGYSAYDVMKKHIKNQMYDAIRFWTPTQNTV